METTVDKTGFIKEKSQKRLEKPGFLYVRKQSRRSAVTAFDFAT